MLIVWLFAVAIYLEALEVPLAEAKRRWLTAIDQWANRLGCWRDRNNFPIAAIKVKDTITGKDQLYFVVA